MAGTDIDNGTATRELPKDWFPGLVQNLKFDLQSGFIIFLIALPLSLGIAIASGAPPIAGVIAGIIGGILGSLLSGSYITINGAAAGLIVIVLGAITGLGSGPDGTIDFQAGFRYALAVGVICGIIQIAMGLLKMGKLTNMFPLSVVHGMLAGIGVIIMGKQIHTLFGVGGSQVSESSAAYAAYLPDFLSQGMIPQFMAIPDSIGQLNPVVTMIGFLSLAMMILWPKLPPKITKIIPAPMAIILITVPLGYYLQLDASYLVSVPLAMMDSFAFPDFGKIGTGLFWKFVAMYVFVASLESLLTASAMDKMDPWKRRSNMNMELIGKGGANTLSSLIGGLPMIAEVVRSSANVMNGARTRWANFYHGVFLLVSVALIPAILNMIPLAALAGMLAFIGFRLAHPKEFVHAAHIGKEELLYLVVTTIVTVATDLLIGIATGFVLATIVNFVRGGLGNIVTSDTTVVDRDGEVKIALKGMHGFNNFVSTRKVLDSLPAGKNLTIDFDGITYMDHTVHERFHDFEGEYELTGGTVKITGKERMKASSHSPVSALVRA